ncbi:MAG: polysulfide reductase NrfD [Campylobacter sp.]|nr:polysulfide reductase NrfD [Campylobacter sp.]
MNNMWGVTTQYDAIYWPWPIAVYLFLAGLSAGCVIASILVKNKNGYDDATVKAGALIAPIAITLGLLLLIIDLGKPLSFYWLLIKYNLSSVMSIGVICLLLFTPLAYFFAVVVFAKDIAKFIKFVEIFDSFKNSNWFKFVEKLLFVLGVCVGIYTGFLLGAISKIPLWNTPVLPVLFLFSGLSAGIAINVLGGMVGFKNSINQNSIKYLLSLDLKVIMFEILLLFALFVGMYFTPGSASVVATQALTHQTYGVLFWVGVVGVGLISPIVIAFSALKDHAYKPKFILLNSLVVLVGVFALRYYIVYAGQICTGAL